MTKANVREAVLKSLRRFLKDDAAIITGDTMPIGDLGLDSQDGVSWAIDLEDEGIKIPGKFNPLVEDKPRRHARTFDEIVDFVMKFVS